MDYFYRPVGGGVYYYFYLHPAFRGCQHFPDQALYRAGDYFCCGLATALGAERFQIELGPNIDCGPLAIIVLN